MTREPTDRRCAGCGCLLDERTPRCATCRSRHWRRWHAGSLLPALPATGRTRTPARDLVEIARVWPFLVELVERSPSASAAARAAGLRPHHLLQIMGRAPSQRRLRRIKKTTAARVMAAVLELRDKDAAERAAAAELEQKLVVYAGDAAVLATTMGGRKYDPRYAHGNPDRRGAVPETWRPGRASAGAVETKENA